MKLQNEEEKNGFDWYRRNTDIYGDNRKQMDIFQASEKKTCPVHHSNIQEIFFFHSVQKPNGIAYLIWINEAQKKKTIIDNCKKS